MNEVDGLSVLYFYFLSILVPLPFLVEGLGFVPFFFYLFLMANLLGLGLGIWIGMREMAEKQKTIFFFPKEMENEET